MGDERLHLAALGPAPGRRRCSAVLSREGPALIAALHGAALAGAGLALASAATAFLTLSPGKRR
jgi:hypothetical protein